MNSEGSDTDSSPDRSDDWADLPRDVTASRPVGVGPREANLGSERQLKSFVNRTDLSSYTYLPNRNERRTRRSRKQEDGVDFFLGDQ